MPSAQSVFIQKGKVVSIDELILVRDGPPSILGGGASIHSFILLLLF